ncbi:MAG: hypothetical protein HYX26_08480 [Acidobacteriales bacterium]|nr:hypothetical protein [Terriglobales bacterium]
MADQLYLNLWFPTFDAPEMATRLLAVLKLFPYSKSLPGIRYAAVHPLDLSEPLLFEQTFTEGAEPEIAVGLLAEFLADDHAYEIEAAWDLWTPVREGTLDEKWELQPAQVRVFAHGDEFEEGLYKVQGHIQVDFGLDAPFLDESDEVTDEALRYIRVNIQKLVDLTQAVEKHCGVSGRVLWSESEENLAQKLIAKLQRTH